MARLHVSSNVYWLAILLAIIAGSAYEEYLGAIKSQRAGEQCFDLKKAAIAASQPIPACILNP